MMSRHGGAAPPAVEGSLCILDHPKYKELLDLKVAEESEAFTTLVVYLDLLEVRCWADVNTVASRELGLLYVTGRPAAGQPLTVVLPVSSQASVSHRRIQEIMRHTCTGTEAGSVTLAIVESDSTVVYYRLTDGLVTPEPPDSVEDVDNKQWRRHRRQQW